MDMRKNGRKPYGYEIIGGKAVVREEEANRLLMFFRLFLSGETMAEAARMAHLPCSATTYPNYFSRKEYCGTDFYPRIITPEYQQELIAEWEKRKTESPRHGITSTKKGVKVYTDFRLARPGQFEPTVPVDCAAALYQRIRATYKKKTRTPAGK